MIESLQPLLFLILTLLAGLPAWAQTAAPPTTKAQTGAATLEQVQALLNANQPDAALSMLSRLPQAADNDIQVKHFYGLAYYQKGDYVRAIESLALAVKQGQAGSRLYQQGVQLLAMSHYFLGHTKASIPYLEEVVSWSGDNVETLYVLGISYLREQNVEKSREAFARMFRLSPNSAAAYLINAQMMIRQQVESLAEKELQKALELDPKLPQANFLLGEMAIYRADLDLGIQLLQKEIALNPGFAMAYYRLGEALTRKLKWDEALAPLQKSIWLNPYFSGPFIVLGKVYLKKSDLINAESILRRALQMDPNNFSGHHLLAQVLQQANRLDEARKEFELADRLRINSEK